MAGSSCNWWKWDIFSPNIRPAGLLASPPPAPARQWPGPVLRERRLVANPRGQGGPGASAGSQKVQTAGYQGPGRAGGEP